MMPLMLLGQAREGTGEGGGLIREGSLTKVSGGLN